MALNRTEIELLIKARNDAQGAFDQLTGQLKKVTGETDKSEQSQERFRQSQKKNQEQAGATGLAYGLLAERIGTGLVRAFNDSVQAANRLDAGLIGLKSVANSFGQDANAAQAAAQALAKDGLMSVGEAATSLKNLLAAGFGLDQAIELVTRFKDSAAFGRQAALGFGQAVSSATEGIKNGNSILVDNAGVTKNLSNMLVEAGFSAQDLSKASSDVNIRMALFNGIIKETTPQLGDAARYLDTAAGKQAAFSAQVEIAQQKIGKALQPALAATLETLTPLVQMIGTAAPVIAPLGAAVGLVVTPMLALKSAMALGIVEIGTLKSAWTGLSGVLRADVFSVVRSGLTGLVTLAKGAGSGIAAIPGLIMAAPWAAAATAIGAVAIALVEVKKRQAEAALQAETQASVQYVINRAIEQGAVHLKDMKDRTEQYAAATKFLNDTLRAKQDALKTNIGVQRAALEQQLLAGQITRAQYDDEMILLQAQERRETAAKNKLSLQAAITDSEKKFRAEIEATGLTMGQLLNALKQDEDAFKAWAETMKLSDDTVSKLKDKLKAQDQATKDQTKSKKEAAKAEEEFRKQLEATTGVLTQQGLNEKMAELERFTMQAATQGTPALTTAVKTLWPELQKLRQQAKDSGLAVTEVDALMAGAAESAGLVLQTVRQFNQVIPAVQGVTEANRVNLEQVRGSIKAQEELAAAYHEFGLKTPDELRKVAEESRRNYEVLRASGTATASQLKEAYNQMVRDQKTATGQLPSFWETTIAPSITRTLGTLNTAVQGSFAQMMLGAKGFGEGWKDIWNSMKASALQIMNDILGAFMNSFLKGLIGSLSGNQGAFRAAFGSFMGGASPGGGMLSGITGMFGGGSSVATGTLGFPGWAGAGTSAATAGGGGGAAGGGGGLLGLGAGALGGLAAGGAGVGLGLLGKEIFGGAGWKAGGFGAGSGFATGAAIGSVVPGIGTIVGGVVGGLAGLFSGLIGKKESEKVNDARDKVTAQFGTTGTGEGSGFLNLASELAKLSEESGGGFGGGKLFENFIKADTLKEFEAALKAIEEALNSEEYAAIQAGEAHEAKGDAAQEAAADTTAAMDEAGKATQALTQEEQNAVRVWEELQQQLHTYGERGQEAVEGVTDSLDETGDEADEVARRIRRALGDLRFTIPVDYDVEPPPEGSPIPNPGGGESGGEPEGEAAHGVMATRPGLVLFGEGQEPEVGGPKSFFRDVLQSLQREGLGLPANGGDGSGAVSLVFNITAMSAADMVKAVQDQVLPILLETLRRNVRGSQTDLKVIVGGR